MKLTRRLFEIRIDDPEGGEPATFVFEEPKAAAWHMSVKKILEMQQSPDRISGEVIFEEWQRMMLANLREVKNLYDAEGNPVTVADIKDANVYRDIFQRVALGFQSEVARGGREKKPETQPSPDSPNA